MVHRDGDVQRRKREREEERQIPQQHERRGDGGVARPVLLHAQHVRQRRGEKKADRQPVAEHADLPARETEHEPVGPLGVDHLRKDAAGRSGKVLFHVSGGEHRRDIGERKTRLDALDLLGRGFAFYI